MNQGILMAGFHFHIIPLPVNCMRTVWLKPGKPGMYNPIPKSQRRTYAETEVHKESCDAPPATPMRASSIEPSVWGDFFIHYEPQLEKRSEEWMRERAENLKEEVRQLFGVRSDMPEKMNLVDTIQHLGIDHLFEEEIDTALRQIHESKFTGSSLHEVALRFRLLRENGIWVHPESLNLKRADAFMKFKGDDGRFSSDIAKDTRGLLSLYNAAYLLINGEPELEEAISFARHHLESMSQCSDLQHPLAHQVKRYLHLPLPRTVKRVEARQYILEYEQERSHNPVLLELAKLDYNLLQHVHLKELKSFSKWCNDLYEYIGLSYVRDRAVELYTCTCIYVHKEALALTRMTFSKLLALAMILDDTYDVHATIDECRMLDIAIQRWDESAVCYVPEYLRNFYDKLLRNFKEIEDEVPSNEKYRVASTKEEFQKLSGAHLQAAEWFHNNHMPSFKDQVDLSIRTSGVKFLFAAMTIGRGDAVTKEAMEWLFCSTDNDVVIACAKMVRFMNDVAAFKHGTNKADMPSSVECYINEYKVTSDIAFDKLDLLVEDEWRTINQARFQQHELLSVVQMAVKITHSCFFFYHERRDALTFSAGVRETIESIYVTPIPI
ncbi:hypothetical protein ACP70R_002533 [Stipagrostis hirtigluma subsp. patula]